MNNYDYIEFLKKVPIGTLVLFETEGFNKKKQFEVIKVDNLNCAIRNLLNDEWILSLINNYRPSNCIFLDEIGKSLEFDKDIKNLLDS